MDLAGFLRRALIVLPFAVVITVGGFAYMMFVGQYSPYLTCTAELQHEGLEEGQFGELMKTVCTKQLDALKKAHPDAYKCGSHCIVDAKTKEEDDGCYAKCPGFVDPLSPDDVGAR
ncbi:MAG: hypothetical protein ABI183_19360 [Polyangiaceae bacterium]